MRLEWHDMERYIMTAIRESIPDVDIAYADIAAANATMAIRLHLGKPDPATKLTNGGGWDGRSITKVEE
jgi:hypothetical protein